MVAFVFHILKMNMVAAAIIFLVILISHLTKKKYSLKWKYYMWLVISVFLLIPVKFSAGSAVRLEIDEPVNYRSDSQGTAGVGNSSESRAVLREDRQPYTRTGDSREADRAPMTPGQRGAEPVSIRISSRHISAYGVLEIFGVVWLIGIALSAGTKGLRYYFSLHKMMRWSYPVEDSRTMELYRWICMKKHIRRAPGLLISPELSSPVLAGLRHPGLYLTEEDYDPEELKFILSHELTHYKRRDLWYKMLLLTVSTIYWFNPALYRMRSEAEKDIENLCDGIVVENYTREEQAKYGRLLLKTAALQNHVPYLAASLNDSTLIFKDRITYMRNLEHLKRNGLAGILLTGLMVSMQVLVGSTVQEAAAGDGLRVSGFGATAAEMEAEDDILASGAEDGAALRLAGVGGGDRNVSQDRGADQFRAAVSGQQGQNQDGAEPDQENVQTFRGEPENGLAESASSGNAISEAGWTGTSDAGYGEPEAPAVPQTAETLGYTLTDQQITLYEAGGNGAAYVNKATNGNWYDGSGRQYAAAGGGLWTCLTTGTTWSDASPETPADHATDQTTVIDGEGYNRQTLYSQADGSWQNIAGGVYTANGDGTWTGPDGTVWYGN